MKKIFATIFSLILATTSLFIPENIPTKAAVNDKVFSFTSTQVYSFYETNNHRVNLGCSLENETTVNTYVHTNILDHSETAQYINFLGMNQSELNQKGVKILYIPTAKTFQLVFGPDISWLKVGKTITFLAGMPVFYQADGISTKMILKTNTQYGISKVDIANQSICLVKMEDYTSLKNGGSWGMKERRRYNVGEQVGGYYNNIVLSDCNVTKDVTEMRFELNFALMSEFFSFASLTTEECIEKKVKVFAIKDGIHYVIQLQWGDTMDLIKNGDKVLFKKGLPIIGNTSNGEKVCYYLDRDYCFSIMQHEDGANGYVLVKNRESYFCIPGDMDEDKLLNMNDLSLMKKQLLDLVEVSHLQIGDVNEDGKIGIQDYMHGLHNWTRDEEEDYTQLYSNEKDIVSLQTGESVSYVINKDIDKQNYIRLTYKTTENLHGIFSYKGDDGRSYEEEFFLAADEIQFRQFFDNYRLNGQNVVGKTLLKITLKNVGDTTTTLLLNSVEISDRDMLIDDMLYIENESLKIGADLNMGGSLGYFESLEYHPVEIQDTANKDICVEIDHVPSKSTRILDDNVNLINIYDLGRQMQQSYYIDVLDADYTHGYYNNNDRWPYNPVQAGDKYVNQSQIIDYRVIDTENSKMIYIKVRAMDWAQANRTTRSYMENYYRIDGNLLYVDNTFINWEGFKEIGKVQTQELPAFYTIQSFNYFVEGKNTSKRTTYGSWTNVETGFTANGEEVSEWYAWVNADADTAFGLGIYIPMAAGCVAGRCATKRTYVEGEDAAYVDIKTINQKAYNAPMLHLGHQYLDDMYTSEYQNCFLVNTSYIAPVVGMKIQEYRSYEYTYVLTADKLNNMSETFDTLEQEEKVINDSFLIW